MAAIHVSYGVEIAIDECLAKLTKTSKAEQSVGDMGKAMALQPPSLNGDQTPSWSIHSYYSLWSALSSQVQNCIALQTQQEHVSKHQGYFNRIWSFNSSIFPLILWYADELSANPIDDDKTIDTELDQVHSSTQSGNGAEDSRR